VSSGIKGIILGVIMKDTLLLMYQYFVEFCHRQNRVWYSRPTRFFGNRL